MTQRGADWYKREPRAFLDGVRGLREREIAVYTIVLDLIYAGGGTTLHDIKHIASYFSDTGTAAVRNIIERLVELDKLQVDGEFLTNRRAINEAKTREELRKTRSFSGSIGGVSSGKSRRDVSKNNALPEANASPPSLVDKSRVEDTLSKEDKVPPPALPEHDPRDFEGDPNGSFEDQYWALAKTAQTAGIPRSLLGKLANLLNGDFERGVGIITDALKANAPRPYVSKIIKNVESEGEPLSIVHQRGVPTWVIEARAQGYPVEREGKSWRMAGVLYDDAGKDVGW